MNRCLRRRNRAIRPRTWGNRYPMNRASLAPKISTDRDSIIIISSAMVRRMARSRRLRKPACRAGSVMAVIPFSSSEKAWAADQRRASRERGRAGKTFS